jgi:hypothetical protein
MQSRASSSIDPVGWLEFKYQSIPYNSDSTACLGACYAASFAWLRQNVQNRVCTYMMQPKHGQG